MTSNEIRKAWLTPHTGDLSVLSLGVEMDTAIRVSDERFEARGIRTIMIGLLSDEALRKIRDAISVHLEAA